MCIYIYNVYIYIYTHVYVYVHAYVYVCVCVCVCVYIYITLNTISKVIACFKVSLNYFKGVQFLVCLIACVASALRCPASGKHQK